MAPRGSTGLPTFCEYTENSALLGFFVVFLNASFLPTQTDNCGGSGRKEKTTQNSTITFTFSCQKQSSGGFLLNGNHIAHQPPLLTHTHTRSRTQQTHTHTHTYNCCSQGNMKGPGRYRDILGPLIYLPWPGAPALSKCQQKIMHTQRQSYLFKNRSRSPQFSQATQRDKRRQYTATKSRCLLFIQLLAFFLNIPSVFYPFFVFIFALC